jgi:hypothetical protein
VPKILKMPVPKENRPDTKPTSNPASGVVPFPSKRDADFDQVTKWVNLGDQVLGNDADGRKKA